MAVRTPIYWTGDGIRPMSTAQVDDLINRVIYAYGQNPSVTIDYVSSNGNLDQMQDTRFQAGSSTTRIDRFANAAETPDISLIAPIVYDHMNELIASGGSYPTDVASRSFPCYLDANNDINSMTLEDFKDTFIYPAINIMVSVNPTQQQRSGTYVVLNEDTTVPAGLTPVSSNPIFQDTVANTQLYTSGGIPEARDQPTTAVNWYLYQYDATSVTINDGPLYLNSNTHLQEMSTSTFDVLSGQAVRHAAGDDSNSGHQIRYQINAAGASNRGDVMTDSRRDGVSSAGYTQRFVNANDYRTQEFPTGNETVTTSYNFTIRKV